jgi:CelD/BcsL family acetyltransferase involved in cellulose biosynthesis
MIDGQAAFDAAVDEPGLIEAGSRLDTAAATARALSGTEALKAYRLFCQGAEFAAPQHPLWIESWVSSHQPDFIVAILESRERIVFALALEIVRRGPLRVARFMAGKHANGNFPAVRPDFARRCSAADFETMFRTIHQARPDIDLLMLERLVPNREGLPNRLLDLPHSQSPNISLEVDLAPGFESIISRSKRLRSKHRWQIRKFEEAGGHRRIEAKTPAEVERLLEEFFRQKGVRLAKKGITDIFANPQLRLFFHALFLGSLNEDKPPYVLHGLEVGGRLLAIGGSSRSGKRITLDLVSMTEGEGAELRPGEFLFYEGIREAAEEGLEVYDFGVGDEPHKRRWCNVEIQHFDVVAPLTVKGRAFAVWTQAESKARRFIRSNERLWSFYKGMRQKLRSRDVARQDED